MRSGCKVRLAGVLFLGVALGGCPVRPPPAAVSAHPSPVLPPLAPHIGRPYEVSGAQSLLTIRVYRGGTLAAVGHNHVIAAHALAGTVYLPDDRLQSSCELRFAVAELTVDEPGLRAQENAADFPPEVPQSAREGTRRNMLGPALLDAAEYPEVVLRAEWLAARNPAGAAAGDLTAHVEVQLRGQRHSIALPVHYRLAGDTLTVTGDTPLRQSELGLTPFSALLGALAVQDEMRLSVRLVAHAAR